MDKNKTILYILYVVVIAILVYAVMITKGFGLWKNSDSTTNTGSHQAVFLSNGQVYFGKLSSTTGQYATLEDIYYLQVQKIQPKPEEPATGKLTLIKLGNEMHAPVDKMKINRDAILFYEDLKEDGKVMEAIKRYKEKGPDTTPTNDAEVKTE